MASATPTTTMNASTARRRNRRRVSRTGRRPPPSASTRRAPRPPIVRCTTTTRASATSSVSAAATRSPVLAAARMGDAMRADGIPATRPAEAMLLDALGTLVELPAPWPALVQELAARGVAVGLQAARAAMRAEMAFYRAEHHRASDRPGLEALRADCTGVLRDALGAPVRDLPADDLQAALLASLRFAPYPEVPGVLRALRAAGAR